VADPSALEEETCTLQATCVVVKPPLQPSHRHRGSPPAGEATEGAPQNDPEHSAFSGFPLEPSVAWAYVRAPRPGARVEHVSAALQAAVQEAAARQAEWLQLAAGQRQSSQGGQHRAVQVDAGEAPGGAGASAGSAGAGQELLDAGAVEGHEISDSDSDESDSDESDTDESDSDESSALSKADEVSSNDDGSKLAQTQADSQLDAAEAPAGEQGGAPRAATGSRAGGEGAAEVASRTEIEREGLFADTADCSAARRSLLPFVRKPLGHIMLETVRIPPCCCT
jgi:hypothetical protein